MKTLLAGILFFSGVAEGRSASVPRSTVTVDAVGSGGYQASYYASPSRLVPEIHLIGVYETRSDSSFNYHPQGTARVHVLGTASAPLHLVVSSYEPTQWIFDGPGRSFISSVVINNSYYPGAVVGIDSSKVISRNFGAYAYAWPSITGGSNTPLLVQGVQSFLGAPISTFSGAYRATEFTVRLVPVPEPATATTLGIALVALCGSRLRRAA